MFVDDEIRDAALRVLDSKRFVKGPEGKTFEEKFAGFCEARYAVATNSGTSALHVALLTLGIKKGDEVIIPSHTFVATASPLLHIGAIPVFAEVDEKTYTLDVDDVKRNITKKTRAIIPVHLYGHPCDMDPLKDLAEDHDVRILEDACQAHGAIYKGKEKVGGIGDMACFSFFPSKNMTVAGDGGMITTNDEDYAVTARALVDQGRLEGKKYEHDLAGFNYRMSELLAAIGSVQLKHLPDWIEKRRQHASLYTRLLTDEDVILPIEAEWAKHVYHLFVIRHKKRDDLQKYLKDKDIGTGIHYPVPVHLQPSIKPYNRGPMPVTEKIAKEVLSLPLSPSLTSEQVEVVCQYIMEWLK